MRRLRVTDAATVRARQRSHGTPVRLAAPRLHLRSRPSRSPAHDGRAPRQAGLRLGGVALSTRFNALLAGGAGLVAAEHDQA